MLGVEVRGNFNRNDEMTFEPTPPDSNSDRGATFAVLITVLGFIFALLLLYSFNAHLSPLASTSIEVPAEQ